MELRDASGDDIARMGELARSAMTTTYALSPGQLDTIVEERFEEDPLEESLGDAEAVVLVAEDGEREVADGDLVVGFAVGVVADDRGELRWLFVDPEHRGTGVGTRLFETGIERLRERGVDRVVATALEANTEGGTFVERMGFDAIDERQVEIGEQSFVEYVYADPERVDASTNGIEEGESETVDGTDVADADLPETDARGDVTVATTEDGTDVYLDRGTIESGTKGPFLVAYTDEAHTERYGYYCSNCGSLDAALGESERIECADCANAHAERSAEAYDDSYL